jgi:hypothetical protein
LNAATEECATTLQASANASTDLIPSLFPESFSLLELLPLLLIILSDDLFLFSMSLMQPLDEREDVVCADVEEKRRPYVSWSHQLDLVELLSERQQREGQVSQ